MLGVRGAFKQLCAGLPNQVRSTAGTTHKALELPMPDPSSESQPPREPFDWVGRYRDQDTPWDLGAAHPELQLRQGEAALDPSRGGGRALVPGCGRGHDALQLARLGFTVTGIDRVDQLGEECGPRLARLGGQYLVVDALAFDSSLSGPESSGAGGFDLIFDHTFLCAIDPTDRPRWAQMVERNLAPGGRLVVLGFPADKPWSEGGPPWRTNREELEQALGPDWQTLLDEPLRAPLARRDWEERWLILGRNPSRTSPDSN